jgi:hypothetical protein
VWSFTTTECATIDDFEGGMTWEGYGSATDDGGGPYVLASTDNPHGGARSMEIQYLNSTDYDPYSAAGRTFHEAQNWLAAPQTLGLFYRGAGTNGSDSASVRLYVRVEDATGSSVDIAQTGVDLKVETWQVWAIPLADLAAIDLSQVKKIYIGVGEETGPHGDEDGSLYVDDVGLCRGRCVSGPSQDLTGDCIVNFEDHAVKAGTWTGNMLDYKALADEWLSEILVWP